LAICHAFKSRSPKEISALFYFAMAHPDLDVDVPQDMVRRSADLAKMRASDWQKCSTTLYSSMGQNARDILADSTHIISAPQQTLPPGGTHTLHNHTPHVRTCRRPGKR
jgi:hypothetical protein